MSAPDASGSLESVLVRGRHGAAGSDPVRIGVRRCDLVQLSARRDRAGDLKKAIRGGLHLELAEPGYASNGGEMWDVMACRPGQGRVVVSSCIFPFI